METEQVRRVLRTATAIVLYFLQYPYVHDIFCLQFVKKNVSIKNVNGARYIQKILEAKPHEPALAQIM